MRAYVRVKLEEPQPGSLWHVMLHPGAPGPIPSLIICPVLAHKGCAGTSSAQGWGEDRPVGGGVHVTVAVVGSAAFGSQVGASVCEVDLVGEESRLQTGDTRQPRIVSDQALLICWC